MMKRVPVVAVTLRLRSDRIAGMGRRVVFDIVRGMDCVVEEGVVVSVVVV